MAYELRPYQREAVDSVYDYLREHDGNPCVVLPTGCHAKDHPILMYDGSVRKVQDIRPGELVMGADSTPRRVLALARGRERMARIVPVKGEPFTVNVNHILSLVSTNEDKPDYPCRQKGGEITNVTVKEYLTKPKSWKHLRKLYHVPVEFPGRKNLPIPPHILGMLIGDGTLTNAVGFTSADEELGDEFISYAESIGCDVRIEENDKGVPTYYAHVRKGEDNPLMEMLFHLGLRGHCAGNKFIPHDYLVASRDDRLQLLAGLLDTDGYYGGHNLEFTTKSFELACDVMFLVRSLGLMAHCAEKYASCQTGAGGWYYRINISGDMTVIPCRRKRHVFDVRKMKKEVLRTGFSVELLPEDDFYGFELDGDHLYVDGNFFVHHNTGKSLVLAQIAKENVERRHGRVLILAHVKELVEQNADKVRKLCPDLKVGIYSAGLKSRDTDESVIVAGIQSVYHKAEQLGRFDLVVVDECFPAGTPIDTPRGMIPIEELYVGQSVRHALGVGTIEAISAHPAKTLIELELNNGKTIRCTPNHPFFTECGWQKADSLAVGTSLFSREDVSDLRKGISCRGTASCGIRVVGIAHIELETPCVVYNLQVEGHPSYYADGVLVHNCHMIAPDGEGMYRTFLGNMKKINPLVRLIGLTATPYRLKGGPICKPENLLNEICYEAGIKEMIDQGYLSPMKMRSGETNIDFSNLHIRGGEFIESEVGALMNADRIVMACCHRLARLTADRKSVLIFASSVKHCQQVAKLVTAFTGLECGVVTGDTPPEERAELLERFKGKTVKTDLFGGTKPPLKYLCNVNVLTTGFDAPNTDCIVLLRPTNSPGLLIQMVGRGFRLSPDTGKKDCIVIDFGGNILRHGSIDLIRGYESSTGRGKAPAKECPGCHALIHTGYRICPECGHMFEHEKYSKIDMKASAEALLSGEITQNDYKVTNVFYHIHTKRNDPNALPTMRIDYMIGLTDRKSEWVCPEHSGYAREKFVKWWTKRCAPGYPVPDTVKEAVMMAKQGLLAEPKSISVKHVAGEKFERIVKCRLGPVPPGREPGDDRLEGIQYPPDGNLPLDDIPF